jgi:hypothetical protein
MRGLGSRGIGVLVCALWLAACGGEIGGSDGPGGPSSGPGEDDGTGPASGEPGSGSGGAGGPGGGAGSAADPNAPYVASPSVGRRLSRAELDNTLRDLLGDDTGATTRLLAEDLYSPYDNDYRSQLASGALIDSLEGLATDVATRVLADPALRARLVPCTPSGAGDAACFREVVQTFGKRAFRRPLSSAEVDAYLPLLDFATENNPDVPHDFYTAVGLVVRAVIQDPEFLYRIEVGTETAQSGIFELDDYETATRLSYLLWGTTPDDGLLAEADAGGLVDATARVAFARTMLDDPRAKTQLQRFHAMWLGYRALPHPAALTAAFQRETSALLDRVIFDEPQSYLNLFTFAETYLDDTLADHYGLPQPGGQGWVDYGSSGRAGILSHGSVLSAFSKFTDTSPTQRGIFVRTRLLCQEIMPPPVNVVADKPPGDKDAVCKYDRYEQHRTSDSCAGCHSQLDPIGFGLENYDIAGRYRTTDDGLPQCMIAGEGEVLGVGTFSGPAELGALLVDEGLVQPCLVRQFFQFAAGRPAEGNEREALSALQTSFQGSDHELRELLLSYIGADAFGLRMEPAP